MEGSDHGHANSASTNRNNTERIKLTRESMANRLFAVHDGVRQTNLARCARGKCISVPNWQANERTKKYSLKFQNRILSRYLSNCARSIIHSPRTFFQFPLFSFPLFLLNLQFSDHKNFYVSHDIPLARTKFDPEQKLPDAWNATDQKKKKRCISDDRWNNIRKTKWKRIFSIERNHFEKKNILFSLCGQCALATAR